jgi:aryl carrier-like protein
MDDNTVSLREHLEALLRERDRRLDERAELVQRALDLAQAAQGAQKLAAAHLVGLVFSALSVVGAIVAVVVVLTR